MKYGLLILFSILLSDYLFAQPGSDEELAAQYLQNGEYEKAADLYEKLFDKNPNSTGLYKSYYQTLLSLKDFQRAEKLVKKQIKKFNGNPVFYVDMGNIFRVQDNPEKAKAQFEQAINLLMEDELLITALANSFSAINEYDYAIKTYQKARKIFRDDYAYSYEMAGLYANKRDIAGMISSYLDFVESNPSRVQLAKNALQEVMEDEKSYKELESQLYKRVQRNPDNIIFSDFLIWLFVQKRDYDAAFIQVRSLDKRYKESGGRVIALAEQAFADNAYEAALKCYEYVLSYGKNSPYYLQARKEMLNCKKAQIVNTEFSQEDLSILEKDYLSFLEEYAKNAGTAVTGRELANLYAFYLHDLNKAIHLLEEIISLATIDRTTKAYCKLDLGDYYLMSGDVWEPVLLYGQVDKEFKSGIIGEEARFRNARLSYYKGEFEWAKAQMNVLKASTSELIANDALNLSVFIQDNLGLDSNLVPMNMFAHADLLIFQNKNEDAMLLLDSLQEEFPAHSLGDDILFAKAKIFTRKRKYAEAEMLLSQLVNDFPADILADDALFQRAELNEKKLNNMEKAKQLYQSIITDYHGSLYVVEARKRFRKLRGDTIN